MSVILMPNVFVIPPEEDNEPTFCCFDAADPLEHCIPAEDLERGSALELISQLSNNSSPVFHRGGQSDDLVMPRRGKRSIAEILTSQAGYEDPDITVRDGNAPGNDSEIIEVIKVRRRTHDVARDLPSSVSEPAFKNSKTFKSRASRAFSSIKNVGRSVSRSRIIPNDCSLDKDASTRAPSPTPSRRGSMIFSSLFSQQPSLKARSSFDSFNEPSPPDPTSPPPLAQITSPSSAEMHGFVPCADSDDEDDEEEIQAIPRALRHHSSVRSPSPTSISQLNRRRFSVLNLFSASKDSEFVGIESSTVVLPSVPTPPSLSRDSLGPSTIRTDSTESSTSSGPETPIDEVFPESLPHRTSISLLKRLPSFSRNPRKNRAGITPVIVAEPVAPSSVLVDDGNDDDDNNNLSFGEIRLDSLHFDEMSFDASRF